MKNRNKNRAPNHTKFGAMKHSTAPRTITMSRVSFDENGQFIGTEQVEAKVQFDPRNACYHIMIDDDSTPNGVEDEPRISDDELEQLMATLEAQRGART